MKSNILFYWKIGRFIYNNKDACQNSSSKCSNYLSYYFGDSYKYSLDKINLMKRLYLYFPMYLDCMNNINWNSYLELLKLSKKECYFYYNISLFCGDDYDELKNLIQSNVYSRI